MADPKYQVVARAVRLEVVENKDEVFIVFKIHDENFKQQILKSWAEDVELMVVGKDLVKPKE